MSLRLERSSAYVLSLIPSKWRLVPSCSVKNVVEIVRSMSLVLGGSVVAAAARAPDISI